MAPYWEQIYAQGVTIGAGSYGILGQAKSFFLYDGSCFTDRAGMFTADLALSLDVIYHLTEDTVFEIYLRHPLAAGQRLVVITP